MNDERLVAILGSFYEDTATPAPDPGHGLEEVSARVRETRQRGRWWPLPTLRRRSAPAAQDEGHPVPTDALVTEPIQIVTRRTHTMFSPIKAVTTVALAAAIGSVLLIATPVHRRAGSVPGAEVEVVGESTGVTGTSVCSSQSGGTFQGTSAPYSVSGLVLTCHETASDPRVTGTSTVAITIEGWSEGLKEQDPSNSITWNDYALEGPEGTWSGYGYGFYDADGVAHLLAIATGSGAYEGLTYMQSFIVPPGSSYSETIGLIQTGSLPPGLPVVPPPSPASG